MEKKMETTRGSRRKEFMEIQLESDMQAGFIQDL